MGSAISFRGMCNPPATVESTIIAFNAGGEPVEGGGGQSNQAILTCCDIYGNEGGDWVGEIADQNGVNGNFSADPLFCRPGDGSTPMIHSDASPFSLHSDSPCLAGNHPYGYDCGLIGAHGQGCGLWAVTSEPSQPKTEAAAVEIVTWGKIKTGYKR